MNNNERKWGSYMKWIETTLRKNTKTPKICRDMFITDSRGVFNLCEVKNGRQVSREEIDNIRAAKLKNEHLLRERSSGIFNNCSTYRTSQGWEIIDAALAV